LVGAAAAERKVTGDVHEDAQEVCRPDPPVFGPNGVPQHGYQATGPPRPTAGVCCLLPKFRVPAGPAALAHRSAPLRAALTLTPPLERCGTGFLITERSFERV
jgi:hypothetical protein